MFAGYGISASEPRYDDYAGLDVKGKILLILRQEPQQDNPDSVFQGKKTTPYAYIRTKLQVAKKQGAAAVLLVNAPFNTRQAGKDELTSPSGFGTGGAGIPFAHLTQATVDKILGQTPLKTADQRELTDIAAVEAEIDRTGKPVSMPVTGWTAQLQCTFQTIQADVANVIGVLEGQGPRAEETIVLGAHYDHLGFGGYGSRRPS
ncbi:MAG: aminopeptidase, partial [Planctomycetes bacterium]|nr:aminopeptidase [Planctomycetota bacterium]